MNDIILFNVKEHKYISNTTNKRYTSVTQVIEQYKKKIDLKYWAMANAVEKIFTDRYGYLNWNDLKREHTYKGLVELLIPKISKKRLKLETQKIKDSWDIGTKVACDKGNVIHNGLENNFNTALTSSVKETEVHISSQAFTKLRTISDVIANPTLGQINLKKLKANLGSEYSKIYNKVKELVNKGFGVYAEICVYNTKYMVSGLIDLLLYSSTTGEFYIIDWKTNKDNIYFQSGYYRKEQGIKTTNRVLTKEYLLEPLDNLYDCKGSIYSLQLSQYAYLLEQFGIKCKGLYLYHIRSTINILHIEYLKEDIINMLNHFKQISK